MKEHVMTTDTSTHLVMTVEEAAQRLGIGRTFMYALVKSGAIESVCIGRLRRIPEDALIAFVRALRVGHPGDGA
jgi:excisionase family DNA binding protein